MPSRQSSERRRPTTSAGPSASRRGVLQGALLGSAALLSACGFRQQAQRVRVRASALKVRTELPAGMREALEFPLVEALLGRRSRRFALGNSLPAGPLAHTSKHEPRGLEDWEQMMVLTSVAGNTGWQNLIPHNPLYLPKIPNYSAAAGGRTFPSAAGFHTTEFFFTDDDGTYFLPTRDAPSLVERDAQGAIGFDAYLEAHRKRIVRISDTRLHIPRKAEHMEMHNTWCANVPGSTLVMPVADLAQHHLASLCYLVQNGACVFDDISGNAIPGLEAYKDLVDVENAYPLGFLEQLTLAEASVEVSTSCYAGMLMLQALGLGGWVYGGINPFSLLGTSGDPDVPGLGFTSSTDERWPLPNVTGLKGVFEGFCPPFYGDMREATDALVERKFGAGGPFSKKTSGPYRNNAAIRGSAEAHDERFKACVALMAQYIYDKFGRFPGTMSSMLAFTYLQAHNLDLDFYDKHLEAGGYLSTHARRRQS